MLGSVDGRQGTTIIEIRTDRAENLALHRRVAEAVTTALQETRSGRAGSHGPQAG